VNFFVLRLGVNPKVLKFFRRQARGLSVGMDCCDPIVEVGRQKEAESKSQVIPHF
jgi:hypothetical protein